MPAPTLAGDRAVRGDGGARRTHFGEAPFDAFPEFAPPRVEVQTEAPGLSSEEVEALVTTPLEAALGGTPGLAQMRSKSVLGLSSIVILFAPGSDLMAARTLVQERIARSAAQLPSVARAPVMLSPLSSTSRVLKIGMWSATHSQMALTDLARWTVRPRLMAVPGIANVAIWGERDRQLQVRVDPERLLAHGIAMERVLSATRDAVSPRAGGFVDIDTMVIAGLVQTYLQERIREVLSGGSGALVVRIYGSDLALLRDQASSLATELDGISGVDDARPESQVLVPQIEGVAAAMLSGGAVSLGTLVGLVTVVGIAARNGIMLISHFRHLQEHEGLPFGTELVVRGAMERLVPIVMTALATGLALVPLVLAGDAPGHEIEHPMAVVILGGIVSSTVLNLLVLPVLYLRHRSPRPT